MKLEITKLITELCDNGFTDFDGIRTLVSNIITQKWEDHFSAVAVGQLLMADSTSGGKIWLAIAFRNGGYWSVYRIWGSKKNILNGKGIMGKKEPDTPNSLTHTWRVLDDMTYEKMNISPEYAMKTGHFFYEITGPTDPTPDPAEPTPITENGEIDLQKLGYVRY